MVALALPGSVARSGVADPGVPHVLAGVRLVPRGVLRDIATVIAGVGMVHSLSTRMRIGEHRRSGRGAGSHRSHPPDPSPPTNRRPAAAICPHSRLLRTP